MARLYFISRHSGKMFRGVETYAQELAKRCHATILKSGFEVLSKKSGSIIISTGGRLESIFVRLITWIKGQKLIIPGQSGLGFDDRLNLYCFPDVFVSLTNAQNNWAQKINPFVKKVVIPNGVDLDKFKPQKTKPKTPTIGYVAAFYPEKRHELLIRAIAKIKAKLILVGSNGPDQQRITELCQKLLPNRFQILNVSYSQMPEIYQKFSLFVYITVPWESFGIAMLEAMATNIPVVATDDPIRREIVGNAGLFATPENLTEKINQALKKHWGDMPRRQAEKYSWNNIAKKYLNLINSL